MAISSKRKKAWFVTYAVDGKLVFIQTLKTTQVESANNT